MKKIFIAKHLQYLCKTSSSFITRKPRIWTGCLVPRAADHKVWWILKLEENYALEGSLFQRKQDWNSSYRCALRGLRIFNLGNLYSLLIWVTFIFEWHSYLSDIPICMTFQFEWHSNLSEISFWGTFNFKWHFILSDIPFWIAFHFKWHSISSDTLFWVTFHFESQSFSS